LRVRSCTKQAAYEENANKKFGNFLLIFFFLVFNQLLAPCRPYDHRRLDKGEEAN
jgi:hypothetical protein